MSPFPLVKVSPGDNININNSSSFQTVFSFSFAPSTSVPRDECYPGTRVPGYGVEIQSRLGLLQTVTVPGYPGSESTASL
eukprot:1263242-Rhodomonas_salina.1